MGLAYSKLHAHARRTHKRLQLKLDAQFKAAHPQFAWETKVRRSAVVPTLKDDAGTESITCVEKETALTRFFSNIVGRGDRSIYIVVVVAYGCL